MWAKLFSGLFCLLLLYCGVSPAFETQDWYDANGRVDLAVKAMTPAGIFQRAETYTDLIQRQDIDGLHHVTDPSIVNDAFDRGVADVARYGSTDKPTAIRLLGYTWNTTTSTNGGTWTNRQVIIGHYYPDKVIIATTYFHEQNGKSLINGINLHRLTKADIASLTFTLAGKSAVHYGVLAICALILAFSLTTLFVTFTRPRLKWRIVWVIVVALGVGQITFNWSTATFAFGFGRFWAPQVTFVQDLFAPMMINFWLPIGAVLFWLFARQKPVVAVPEKTPDLAPEPQGDRL